MSEPKDVACWQGVGGVMLLAGPGAELKGNTQ